MEGAQIEIPRSEDFAEKARVLGDFINQLDLPADKHNKLVDLIVDQVKGAEEEACKFGIDLGIKLGNHLND